MKCRNKEKKIEEKPAEVNYENTNQLIAITENSTDLSLEATDENKPVNLYPQYELNPYLRAQILKNQKPVNQPQIQTAQNNQVDEDDEDDEDEGEHSILPFSGVHKPLEEMFQKYEKNIYDFIRRRILPGSNILLVGYFSTLFVVDLTNPITVVLYILGIMSMFWCIQSFLLVIDHIQFPPETD